MNPGRKKRKVLRQISLQLLILAISIGVGSLFVMEEHLEASAQSNLERYRWVVFVQGDQVAVDQVGQYLKELDGISRVEFFSPAKLMDSLQGDPVFQNELSGLASNPFLPCWQIEWAGEFITPSFLQDRVTDIRSFPGVRDVAYDQDMLARYYNDLIAADTVQLLLSILILLVALVGIILLGLTLFGSSKISAWTRAECRRMALDFIIWSAGYFVLQELAAPPPMRFLWGGVALALLRQLWFKGKA